MNTFVSKKLGEVLAFARIGSETAEEGREGFLNFLNEEAIDKIGEECDSLEAKIEAFANEMGNLDEVEEAAEETDEKVRNMRDEYIDGEWDKSDEVLEWMGFYTGAALVHWHLIMGSAEAQDDGDLRGLASEALAFYNSLFVLDEEKLHEIGETAGANADGDWEADE